LRHCPISQLVFSSRPSAGETLNIARTRRTIREREKKKDKKGRKKSVKSEGAFCCRGVSQFKAR
jgi:hypothetical protein